MKTYQSIRKDNGLEQSHRKVMQGAISTLGLSAPYPFRIMLSKGVSLWKLQSCGTYKNAIFKDFGYKADITQGLLNRWTSQLDLECTTGGLERVFSVHNST